MSYGREIHMFSKRLHYRLGCWLVCLLGLTALSAQAATHHYVQRRACDTNPICCGNTGFYLNYENVFVKPHFTQNNAYYLDDLPSEDGQIAKSFDWDYCYSPRVELGYICKDTCLGVRLGYWHLDACTDLTAHDPGGDISVGFAGDGPSNLEISGASDAKFSHELEFDLVNVEAVIIRSNFLFSAGVCYLDMDQEYKAAEIGGSDHFEAHHDFNGWGITGSAELHQPITCDLSLFIKARTSILFGDRDWVAESEGNPEKLTVSNDEDVIAIASLQAGIDWRRCVCGVMGHIYAAVEGQHWTSAGTGGPINNATFDEGNYQNANPLDSNLGLLGGIIGIGVNL